MPHNHEWQSRIKAVERRFAELTDEWKAKKQFLSSVTQIAMLPSYQQIIGMGPAALPLIFAELEREPDHCAQPIN